MAHRVVYTRPYDAEVEYLESGNTQFIDTGIIATNNTNFKMKVYTDSIQRQILGQYEVVQNKHLAFGVYYFNNVNKLVLYGVKNTYLSTRSSITDKLVEIELRDNKFILDSSVFDVTRNNVIGNKTLYLFKLNGLEITPNSHLKIYYCKIWNGDTLVRDFIPVRKGSIGYLYDKVSKKLFANKGTGNFILGQDVANPVPNIRRVFRFGNKRFVMAMPYDSRVEYLELTGTQWLDTRCYGDINTAMECVCKVTDTTYGYVIAGSRTSATVGNISFLCGKFNNYYQYMCDFGDYTNSRLLVKKSDVNDYVKLYTSANLRKAVDVVNETEYTNSYVISSTSQTPYTIKICRHSGNYGASYKHFIGRIKSFKLWSSDALLLDLIPVRKNGIGYMYDRVSGKLFGNAGTGNFILGNDIND